MTRLPRKVMRDFFFEGREPFIIEEGGKKGVKKNDGEVVIPPIYETIEEMKIDSRSYYYMVKKDGKYGIVSVEWDNVVTSLEVEYDSFQWLHNDLLLCKDGKYGVWDKFIYIPCEYDEITRLGGEKILAKNYLLLRKGNKYGLSINTKLLPTIYDEIAPPIDYWNVRVKKDGVWGYLDKEYNFTTDMPKAPWEDLDNVSECIVL